MKEKNLTPVTLNHKLFLVINSSNEKFTFKTFTDDAQMKDYFHNLNNIDFFEDISFSVTLKFI
jgi:hypothetical protein